MEPETISKNGASLKSQMSKRKIIQRTFLFFASLCISVANTLAQDIITLKNGNDIQAVVQEIGELDVKYKKFDNPNGPNYTLKKSEIFMIKYENGDKDVFTNNPAPPITTTPVVEQSQRDILYVTKSGMSGIKVKDSNGQTLLTDEVLSQMTIVPEALQLYKDGQSKVSLGKTFGVISSTCALTGCLIWLLTNNFNYWIGGMAAGVGFLIPNLTLISSGNGKIESAVGIYNGHIQRKSNMSLNLGVTKSGGFGFTFNF